MKTDEPLKKNEIEGQFYLDNHMCCVYGRRDNAVCMDLYEDDTLCHLIMSKHNFIAMDTMDINMMRRVMQMVIDVS